MRGFVLARILGGWETFAAGGLPMMRMRLAEAGRIDYPILDGTILQLEASI